MCHWSCFVIYTNAPQEKVIITQYSPNIFHFSTAMNNSPLGSEFQLIHFPMGIIVVHWLMYLPMCPWFENKVMFSIICITKLYACVIFYKIHARFYFRNNPWTYNDWKVCVEIIITDGNWILWWSLYAKHASRKWLE